MAKAKKAKATKTKTVKTKKAVVKAKTAATLPGRIVEVELKLPLTDAEARKRGKLAWEKTQERDKFILERKDNAARYKARIDALTAEVTKLLEEASEGLEVRPVKAREVKNHANGQIEYWYQGQIRHSRPMTLVEKQQDELPLDQPKANPVPRVSASTGKATAADEGGDLRPDELRTHGASEVSAAHQLDPVAEAHAADEQAQREDVASVIKEEASARSKWSSVDGVRA